MGKGHDRLPWHRPAKGLGRNEDRKKQGAVQLDPFQIPLDVSVNHVFAAAGKLWVTFDAKVGKITGAEKGLGVSVGKKK